MSEALIPVWILGGAFVGVLILAFSFKGSSSMSGPGMHSAGRDPIERKNVSQY